MRLRDSGPATQRYFNPIITLIALIVGALTMSATFSLVETSMLTSRRHSLLSMASQGKRGAKKALHLLDDMDSLLGTVLLWNNFANVLVASLATVLAVRLFDDGKLVLSVTSVITTLTILILSEITPKTFGVRFAEQVACWSAPALHLLVRLTPIGPLIRGTVDRLLAKVGSTQTTGGSPSRHRIAVEELLALIHDKNTLTEVGEGQKSMLYRLVGMHEQSMRDIMLTRSEIEYIDLEDDLGKIRQSLRNCNHHQVPLCNDGLENVHGIVKVRTALLADLNGTLDKKQLRASASEPVYVPETIDPVKALQELTNNKVTMCLVVDEYGGLVGLVSVSDYYRHIFSTPVETSDNGIENDAIVNGLISVREANLRFGLNLSEDEAKTLAGFMIAELGDYPDKPGDLVNVEGATLEVNAVKDRQITQVKIKRMSATTD